MNLVTAKLRDRSLGTPLGNVRPGAPERGGGLLQPVEETDHILNCECIAHGSERKSLNKRLSSNLRETAGGRRRKLTYGLRSQSVDSENEQPNNGASAETESRGALIASARKAKGLNMSELARRVGVSRAAVSYWESGDVQHIDPMNALALASVLDLNVEDLVSPAALKQIQSGASMRRVAMSQLETGDVGVPLAKLLSDDALDLADMWETLPKAHPVKALVLDVVKTAYADYRNEPARMRLAAYVEGAKRPEAGPFRGAVHDAPPEFETEGGAKPEPGRR